MKDLEDLIINKNRTIIEAMKQLDDTAKKILFVIDSTNSFIGTLTDGDIRRYILKNGNLNDIIEFACNKNCYYVYTGFDSTKVKDQIRKKGIQYVPVVDKEKKLVEIIFNEEKVNQLSIKTIKNISIPVIIMAGGFGTRLEPFTKVLPKPLVPVGDKTILEHIIDKFLQYGVSYFWISINYKANVIKSYFSELPYDNIIGFIEEDKPLGTAGSLYLVKNKIKEDCFILTNCDILIDVDFYDIFYFHRLNKYDITLVVSAQTFKIPYGVCEIKEGGLLNNIKEKPEYHFLISTGIYLINTEILNIIPDNEFFNATDLLKLAKDKGFKIGVYPVSPNCWTDIGQWEEYKKTLEKFKL